MNYKTRTIIGVDLGLSKTGISRAIGPLAEPLNVIHEKNINKLALKILDLAKAENVKEIVIGIPEGEIEPLVKKLANLIKIKGVEIVFWDETLTTQDAQQKAIAAGMSRKKRRELEDAFAATVMLQSYLDNV